MNYNVNSPIAEEFIHDGHITKTLAFAKEKASDKAYVHEILAKAAEYKGLTHEEACVLTFVRDEELMEEMFRVAREIKQYIYGKRIVMFAPLYLSDYCVNECTYCGYHHSSCMKRKKLTQEELIEEVHILESLGHKRLALECGEDPVNCPLDYVLECIKTIYSIKNDNGTIRRVNVNVAATTVEDYRRLKESGIGTYILFQETYHKPTYERVHPKGPKHNYEYHTTAHDRAMQGGIDDVGIGVLFGLYDWHYELTAMMMYAEHLEAAFGVGPHTISVPRIRAAENVQTTNLPYAVTDDQFKRIVAICRLAVPYTGIIVSTRESCGCRDEVLRLGVSQVSSGSCTGVGGYADSIRHDGTGQKPQFEVEDHRTPIEITKHLIETGYVPSFCTACYREGRTGDRFMQLCKTGQIANVCQPNSLITLKEYSEDYGDAEFKEMADKLIAGEVQTIPHPTVKTKTLDYLEKIKQGQRDFRF